MPRILDLELLYHKNPKWSKKNSFISYEVKLPEMRRDNFERALEEHCESGLEASDYCRHNMPGYKSHARCDGLLNPIRGG